MTRTHDEGAARASGVRLSLAQKVAPGAAAVIVIDVQNDFVAGGGFAQQAGWDIPRAQAAAARIERWLPQARSAGLPVVFVRSIYDSEWISAPMRERNIRRGLTTPRCLSGSWGAEFYLLRPGPTDAVVTKHRLNAFFGTDLDDVLHGLGIETIILTGVYTEACVESTGRHAYFLDYYVVVASDLTSGAHVDFHSASLASCERDFGVVATSDEISAAWRVDASGARGRGGPSETQTTDSE